MRRVNAPWFRPSRWRCFQTVPQNQHSPRPLPQSSRLFTSTPSRANAFSARRATPKSTFINPNPDIRHIRLNPGLYSSNCMDRNYPSLAQIPFQIADNFEQWKKLQVEAKPLRDEAALLRKMLARSAYNTIREKSVGVNRPVGSDGELILSEAEMIEQKAKDAEREDIIRRAREAKSALEAIEAQEEALQTEMKQMALSLPNLSSIHTPTGTEPIVLEVFAPKEGKGVGRTGSGVVRSHVQIGSDLELIDFAGAAVTSGWGWYFLQNEGALLEQALIQYALEVAQQHGFRVVTPPSMVYGHIASAAGFQPRDQNGERQIYTIGQGGFEGARAGPEGRDKSLEENSGGDGEDSSVLSPPSPPSQLTHVLAGTAEIPLAGMRANTHLRPSDLPDKVVGVSRCYRAEAGARGVDTRGLYRVHEFTKVELFGWTMPDEHDGSLGASTSSSLSSSTPSPLSPSYSASSSPSPSFSSLLHKADSKFDTEHPTRNGGAHFATTRISHSSNLLESIIAVQKHILISLHLPFRVLEQPCADLGASATRKIDMEVFFPARARDAADALASSLSFGDHSLGYGEISSASSCGDYQSRRLGTRVRASPRPGQGVGTPVGSSAELLYVHTCNGTAAAIPRLIAALLENGWDEGRQAVWIPEVLRRYLGGNEWIEGRK